MKVREIMTGNPAQISKHSTVSEAAKLMKSRDIGSVLVTDENGETCGIVTDRDIVIRGLAGNNQNPMDQHISDICSMNVEHISADTEVEDAIRTMRESKVRRLPVMENNKTIGVLSLGDLAVARDRSSVLGEISAAPPNN